MGSISKIKVASVPEPGGRKYSAFWLAFTIGTVFHASALLFTEQVIEVLETWTTFVSWLFGLFAVGNVGEHASKAFETRVKNGNGSEH